jgi:lipid-A-disaccharide synthase-like uncharacterized protein
MRTTIMAIMCATILSVLSKVMGWESLGVMGLLCFGMRTILPIFLSGGHL